MFNTVLVLLVVISILGPALTQLFAPRIVDKESLAKAGRPEHRLPTECSRLAICT